MVTKCIQQNLTCKVSGFHSASIKDVTLCHWVKASLHFEYTTLIQNASNINPVTHHYIPKDLNPKLSITLPFWTQFPSLSCNVGWHQCMAPLKSNHTKEWVWYFDGMDEFWSGIGPHLENQDTKYLQHNCNKTAHIIFIHHQYINPSVLWVIDQFKDFC